MKSGNEQPKTLGEGLLRMLEKRKARAPVNAPNEAEDRNRLRAQLEAEKNQNQDLDAIARRVREVDLESWYNEHSPNLQALTYYTEFLDISEDMAYAMVHDWEHKHYQDLPEHRKKLLHYKQPSSLSQQEIDLCKTMEQQLDEKLLNKDECSKFKGGAFIKLSSRCPKDAVATSKQTEARFRQLVPQGADDNAKIIALNEAHIQSLHCQTGRHTLDLMLSSNRVYEDLLLALEQSEKYKATQGQKGTKWSQNFVLREWKGLPLQNEFRVFVYGDKITAISQYYQPMFYPELIEQKEVIERLIHEFFNQHIKGSENGKERTPFTVKEFVMDVVVDLFSNTVFIIEFNPFGDYPGMGTGTQLFDKDKPSDRDILFGKKPFEFRIVLAPDPHLVSKASLGWKNLIQRVESTPSRFAFYQESEPSAGFEPGLQLSESKNTLKYS